MMIQALLCGKAKGFISPALLRLAGDRLSSQRSLR